jgi:hypothetical protein
MVEMMGSSQVTLRGPECRRLRNATTPEAKCRTPKDKRDQ